MIKDNQKSLNRFHVVLDACVTAFSARMVYRDRKRMGEPAWKTDT